MRWASIKEFEEYEISDTGCIRRGNKVLKASINAQGYLQISLCSNGRRRVCTVHRLLAEAFLPNPKGLEVVRHLDDNKLNNALSNLCWGSYSDNVQDAKANGLVRSKHVVQLRDGVIVQEFASLTDAAKAIGLAFPSSGGASHIKSVCEGKRKTLKGFTFKYVEEGDSN